MLNVVGSNALTAIDYGSGCYRVCKYSILCLEMLLFTRQMLAASWGEPEACQHAIVLFCARDYNIGS